MEYLKFKLSRAAFLETDIATVSEEKVHYTKGVHVRTKATLGIILEAGPRMLIMSLQSILAIGVALVHIVLSSQNSGSANCQTCY